MPKERTHLLIAEETLGRIENASLRQLINNKSAFFYLGAIFPDMLILPFGKGPEHTSWADLLHDRSETSSSGIVHQLLAALREETDDQAEKLVFILGYLTHAAADMIFHPLVFYLSGDYYHRDKKQRATSQASHHHLETQLDIALQQLSGKKEKDPGFSFLSDLSSHEIGFTFEFFAAVFAKICRSPRNKITQYLKIDLALFMIINRLYHNRLFYQFAKLVNFLSRKRADKYFKLLYPPNYRSDQIVFSGDLRFKNPLTGEEREVSLRDLKSEATLLGAQCLETVYQAWSNGSLVIALHPSIEGKNMNHGSIHLRVMA